MQLLKAHRMPSTDDADLPTRLAAYTFDDPDDPVPFSARLRADYGWSDRYTKRVIAEYRRFVLLAVTGEQTVTPSQPVDLVWHLHLIDTRRYWDGFCRHVLGRPLHHEPSRGGPDEAERFRQAYYSTLDRYARQFGSPPPPDIWPDDRRPRQRISLLRRLAAATLGATALAGCAGIYDSSQPGAIQGPTFLVVYLCLWLAAIGAIALLQDRVIARAPAAPLGPGDLGAEALAYLAGGWRRVQAIALLSLHRQGAVGFNGGGSRGRLRRQGPLPLGATAVETALYRAAGFARTPHYSDIQAALNQIRAGLVAQGLWVSRTQFATAARIGFAIGGAVLALGVLRLGFGMANRRPVGLLWLELTLGFIACMWLILSRDTATPAGRRLCRATRAGLRAGPRGAADPDLLTATALFGDAAVSWADFPDYRYFFRGAPGFSSGDSSSGGNDTTAFASSGDSGGGGGCSGGGSGGSGCGGC